MCIVTETADEMETVLVDALIEGTGREECVGNDEVRQLQQFLAVALDDGDVVVCQRHVAFLQLKVARCLMGTQHHAVVAVDVYQPQAHDFQPVLHGTCTTRPKTTNMRGLLARLADVAGINGYGLASTAAKVPQGK